MQNLLIILIFLAPLVSTTFTGFRTDLTRVGANKTLNITQIQNAIIRDKNRYTNLYSKSPSMITSPTRKDSSFEEYLMTLSIGTPPLMYEAILDTGSDLIWTQCQPCKKCFTQPTTIYDPSKSSTVGMIGCNSTQDKALRNTGALPSPQFYCMYNYTYVTGWTSGVLDTETFTFNKVKIPNITFGCSTSSSDNSFIGSSGLVGLGRGPFSLISQLGATRFSYCFSYSDNTSTSPLFIGPVAMLSGKGIKFTPFVNDHSYYLSLKGISIGNKALMIPSSAFALKSDGSGGFVIDSGTAFTLLVENAFEQVKKTISSIVKNLTMIKRPLDFCYQLQSGTSPPRLPNMILHFDGADMELSDKNYMIRSGNSWCLAMLKSVDISILGNYQQQNKHIFMILPMRCFPLVLPNVANCR